MDFELSEALGIDSYQLVGTALGTVVQFGPPLLPSIVLLDWLILSRRARWYLATPS